MVTVLDILKKRAADVWSLTYTDSSDSIKEIEEKYQQDIEDIKLRKAIMEDFFREQNAKEIRQFRYKKMYRRQFRALRG